MSEIVKSSSFTESLFKFLFKGSFYSAATMCVFGCLFGAKAYDMDVKYKTSEKITGENDRTLYFVSGTIFHISVWSTLLFATSGILCSFFIKK